MKGADMLSTHEMSKYMRARRGVGDVIDAADDDPVLLQAEQDGYADRVNDQWVARGHITKGERRVVRFIEGGQEEVVGD